MGVLRAKTPALRGTCVAVVAFLLSAVVAAPVLGQTLDERTLLVLRNGRVVDGNISHNAGGYLVEYKNGSMLVPRSQVLMLADSRQDAYRKLKDALPRNNVKSNLRLARWCITNLLYSQAQSELREALALNPSDGEARRMMVRLEQLLDPDANPEQKSKPTIEQRIMAPPTKSLSGLSRDAARQFVAKVQPILMNSCATSGCHGPQATNGFQLSRVRISGSARRGETEHNLATTLRFVEPNRADASPLLVKPKGNHGRRGQPVFRGRAGARQLELLKQWVRDVSRETSESEVAQSKPRRKTKTTAASKRAKRLGNETAFQPTPALRAMRAQLEQRRVVNDLHGEGRKTKSRKKDVFDPAEFNRKTERRDRK